MLITLNSRLDKYGNRRNMIINYDEKAFYLYGAHVADKGEVINNLPIKEIYRKQQELIARGFYQVEYEVLRNWHE